MDIRQLAAPKTAGTRLPSLRPGDTTRVTFKIKEAGKERSQTFQGVVIKLKHGATGSFTIRQVAHGVGVEHTFPFESPLVQKVEVLSHGHVRRAKLYYLRELSTKRSRIKERRTAITGVEAQVVAASEEQAETASPAAAELPTSPATEAQQTATPVDNPTPPGTSPPTR